MSFHEGNVRRITIKDKNNNILAQFPLTIGIVGTALSPVLAAIGAIAALVSDCTLSIEWTKETTPKKKA